MSEEPPLVLVVEDEPDLADLYAAWLGDEYRVRTAYGGREALDALDDEIDVILLDRRMVTAVEPDFDIVAMGFDDYLVKPVTKDALRETVDELYERSQYDAGVQEFFSLASKKALLESEKSQAALEESEEYRQLTADLEALKEDLDDTVTSMDSHTDFETLFRGFGDGTPDDAAFEELDDG
jgi:DNA-binding response OmpR family regulator